MIESPVTVVPEKVAVVVVVPVCRIRFAVVSSLTEHAHPWSTDGEPPNVTVNVHVPVVPLLRIPAVPVLPFETVAEQPETVNLLTFDEIVTKLGASS
jgi:hypothetical protein